MQKSYGRRDFLKRGLTAASLGWLARKGFAAGQVHPACITPSGPSWLRSNPLLGLSPHPTSQSIANMPFPTWFTGDDFTNDKIPFHYFTDWFNGGPPPEPDESVKVAIVGGGLSGLTTAYLLRDLRPVLFEVRDRVGGNAMGEVWRGLPYSLGSAYVISPDKGSFLEKLYQELGLDRVVRVSDPPDPVEVFGKITDDFWTGSSRPKEEQLAFQRYAEVVTFMAEKAYPEIPLPDDPEEVKRIHALDRLTFREHVEKQMGMTMPPLLAAAVQGYFYSSFGAPMEDISAASGWNFVAAEEFGRWVFPGGNSYMAWSLWKKLSETTWGVPPDCHPYPVRCQSQVIDVRSVGKRAQVSYFDPNRRLRSLMADSVVMAGSKHICKHALHDLRNWDPEKYEAIHQIWTAAYVVANVLLNAPIERDFYDCFLLGDETFPMDANAFEARPIVVDMLRGDFALRRPAPRSVLTLYWPLPWASARFTLLLDEPYRHYAELAVPQIRKMLKLLDVPETSVEQVRISRWGHALPLARPNLIADGICDLVRRPLDDRIYFVNQDNFSLPAVENSLLEAKTVSDMILKRI